MRESRADVQSVPKTTLDYRTHFSVLTAVASALALSDGWRPAMGVIASFGIYGALYSSTWLVASRQRLCWGSKLAFIAAAAALSMSTVILGLAAGRYAGRLGLAGPALVVATAAAFGALTFAVVLRRWLAAAIPGRSAASIALACVISTVTALLSGLASRNGGLWLALTWWYGFSVGLWLHDRRVHLPGRKPAGMN